MLAPRGWGASPLRSFPPLKRPVLDPAPDTPAGASGWGRAASMGAPSSVYGASFAPASLVPGWSLTPAPHPVPALLVPVGTSTGPTIPIPPVTAPSCSGRSELRPSAAHVTRKQTRDWERPWLCALMGHELPSPLRGDARSQDADKIYLLVAVRSCLASLHQQREPYKDPPVTLTCPILHPSPGMLPFRVNHILHYLTWKSTVMHVEWGTWSPSVNEDRGKHVCR